MTWLGAARDAGIGSRKSLTAGSLRTSFSAASRGIRPNASTAMPSRVSSARRLKTSRSARMS
eukprot:11305597-Heterocapsa_arctica.AAC.1